MIEILEKLTPTQELLIAQYRDKWKAIALDTELLNREKASQAIIEIYEILGKPEPQIICCKTLECVRKTMDNQPLSHLGEQIACQIDKEFIEKQEVLLWKPIELCLWRKLEYFFIDMFGEQLERKMGRVPWDYDEYWNCLDPYQLACYASFFDYSISVLNCPHDARKWEVFQSLVKNCGGIFPYENTCIVCLNKTFY